MAERLDKMMAARGLAPSRERAQMLIEAGLVLVDGMVAGRSSQQVEEGARVEVTGEALPYVSRGGAKLEAALRQFRINVSGAICLDVGASTGGFTDCLLQRGAARVVAVDVGHDQMAQSLREDPRVEVREGVNARYLSPEQFEGSFDFAAIDVSFISATLILPAVVPLLRAGAHIVTLIKPEFEAGRDAVGPRGIVRDPAARRKAIERVTAAARDELGLQVRGTMPSPIVGGAGNREFITCLRTPRVSVAEPDTDQADPGP